jgi:hypothetical protein
MPLLRRARKAKFSFSRDGGRTERELSGNFRVIRGQAVEADEGDSQFCACPDFMPNWATYRELGRDAHISCRVDSSGLLQSVARVGPRYSDSARRSSRAWRRGHHDGAFG